MKALQLKRRDGVSVDEHSVESFKAGFHGNVVRSNDPDYDATCHLWNASVQKRPGLVAKCVDVFDVSKAVKFARTHDICVAIRGGGHGVAGWALCDDGLVIDMSSMKRVAFHSHDNTVEVQAGALVGDVSRETSQYGMAVPMGANSNVGIAGLTLGGGIGWLTRKYGLACDNLLSCEIVTADGAMLTADPNTNVDLFWALRGGCGNFGIVTSLRFQTHPVKDVLGGIVMFARNEAGTVLRKYRDFMLTAPDDLTMYAALMSAPNGEPVVALMVCHCGNAAEASRLAGEIRAFGQPLVDYLSESVPYDSMQRIADASSPDGLGNDLQSAILPDLTDDVIQLIVGHADQSPSPDCMTLVQRFGGAMQRVNTDATAFPHRNALYNIGIEAKWPKSAVGEPFIRWAFDFCEALHPYSANTSLLNFLSSNDQDVVRRAFGSNYARLEEVKAKYDPTNFFGLNQNIKPR